MCRAAVYIGIAVYPGITDEEIRRRLLDNQHNGAYATRVCRNCGIFNTSPDGRYKTAEIVDVCKHCFDKKQGGSDAQTEDKS